MTHPMSIPPLRDDAEEIIMAFIKSKVKEFKSSGVIIGMSGGLDSSVVAALCSRGLGRDRVMGVMMPESQSKPEDLEHGILMAKNLKIERIEMDITKPIESFREILSDYDGELSYANLKARSRMIVLYYIANTTNRLVMGCSNKTELMVGYFTKFGDGAADFLPIGDLYKIQVREIAKRIGISESIMKKPPSAGLLKDQLDEDDLGISYDLLDQILFGLETQMSIEDIANRIECDKEIVEKVRRMIRLSVHKRRLPLIAKLGFRTPGFDWREY